MDYEDRQARRYRMWEAQERARRKRQQERMLYALAAFLLFVGATALFWRL